LLRERELLARPTKKPHGDATSTPLIAAESDDRSWTDSSLSTAPPEPPFRFDRYEADAIIGKGGMSVVYRARDLENGAVCALKLLPPHASQDRHGLARFLREVAVLRRVDSPHVVRALDSGLDRGVYFLTMDLVEGDSAKAILGTEGPFDPRRAAAVGRDVA